MKSYLTEWPGPEGFDASSTSSAELLDRPTTASTPLATADFLVGIGIGLLMLGLYLVTLAPTILEADAGEFQFVPWLPGIAHPTGYPLYTVLGWLWTHLLPLGQVAWRMNLLSAVVAALAVALTYLLAQRLLQEVLPVTGTASQRIVAALTALTFAVTPTFWSQALIAEVYALHVLLLAAALWLALRFDGVNFDSTRWLALIVGLGLAHHVTMLWLAPGLVVAIWLRYARRPARQTDQLLQPARLLIQHIVLLLTPLLLYAYLPLMAAITPYATLQIGPDQQLVLYDNSLGGFLRHVTATVFTSELQPAAVDFDRFRLAGELLYDQVGWLGIALAMGGVLVLWRRRSFAALALTGLSALAITVFNLVYFIGDVFVLFIPVWLIVCLWAGVGLLSLVHEVAARLVQAKVGPNSVVALERLRSRLQQRAYKTLVTLLPLFFLVGPIVLALVNFPRVDQRQNWAASIRWQQILAEPLPVSAILISNDRNEIMPMWYYQYVDQQRPDLQGLFPLITSDPEVSNVGRLLDYALASGRPVYLIKPMDSLSLKADLRPEGTLLRATAIAENVPQNVNAPLPPVLLPHGSSETITLVGYGLVLLEPARTIQVSLYWRVTQPLTRDYTSYVHLLAPEGGRLAQSDQRPGSEYYPPSLWQVGEILRDRHQLTLPPEVTDLAEIGLLLRVGMYYQPEPGQIQGMGNGLDLGRVVIEPTP